MGNHNFICDNLYKNRFKWDNIKDFMMKIIFICILSCLICFYCGYYYGQSKMKVKIIEKKVEIIKNVAHKKAKIQASPNASRSELLELMRNNRL